MCDGSQDVAADGTGEGRRVRAEAEAAAGFPRGLNPYTEAKLSRTLLPSSPTALEPGTHPDCRGPEPWDHLKQPLKLIC